jgi:uncharacterized peroxidase-related enzyme
MVAALRADWRTAPLSDADRAMLTFVEKLTLRPATCQADDLRALRDAGFDDRGILQITMITSMFNYLNRVADALGTGR